MQTSAKEVLEAVSKDIKAKGYNQETAARELKYATRQAVSAVLSSGKYMTRSQARRFNQAFGYYEPFLVAGEGTLTGPADDDGTTYYLPQHALLLRPFDTVEEFDKAYTVFLQSMIATYGATDIQNFLKGTIRYIGMLDDPALDWAESQQMVDMNGNPSKYDIFRSRAFKENPDLMKNRMEDLRKAVVVSLYHTYSIMVEEV